MCASETVGSNPSGPVMKQLRMDSDWLTGLDSCYFEIRCIGLVCISPRNESECRSNLEGLGCAPRSPSDPMN